MPTWNPRPVLIDGNNLVVRHVLQSALEDLQEGGRFTGGTFGTIRSLAAVLRAGSFDAGLIAAFFDAGIPDFRREAVPEYKANRKYRGPLNEDQMEQALEQITDSAELLETLGVVTLAYDGWEADDCVARAAGYLASQGQQPVVVSSDRDMWQLMQIDGCQVYDLHSNALLSPEDVLEKKGVPITRWTLYRAIVGDTSDGIVGARGCGEKRAAELVNGLPDAADSMSPPEQLDLLVGSIEGLRKLRKFEQAVVDSEDWLKRVLVAIDLMVPRGNWKGMQRKLSKCGGKIDKVRFRKLCKRLRFLSILTDEYQYVFPFTEAAKLRKKSGDFTCRQ